MRVPAVVAGMGLVVASVEGQGRDPSTPPPSAAPLRMTTGTATAAPLRMTAGTATAAMAAGGLELARQLVAEKWGLSPAMVVVSAVSTAPVATSVPDARFAAVIGSGEQNAELLLVDRAAPPGTPPLRFHAGTRTRALLAVRAIARGDTLRATDLVSRDTVLWGRPSTMSATREPAAGWIARRPIAAGERLAEPAVMPAPAVTSGDAVRAVYRDGSLALALRGIAANSADVGQRVTVRIDMRRRLDGIAVAPGVVALR